MPTSGRVWVAFSGGLDSHVLLHFLKREFGFLDLHAAHINHQLQAGSDQWALHCEKICRQLDVPLQIICVNISCLPGQSLEACARKARYQAFSTLMQPQDIFITAHHQDDQAETVLLQLLRGAGLKGVSAMPSVSPFAQGYLLRPFLNYSRIDLLNYAQKNNLSWIEDPSNQDDRFDRNFLRTHIFPALKKRWPHASQIFSRFAKHCKEQELLLTEMAKKDLEAHQGNKNQINITQLKHLSKTRQYNLLRYWLSIVHELPSPSENILDALYQMAHYVRHDASPEVRWKNDGKIIFCRRYQNHLYLIHENKINLNLTPEQLDWCQKNLKDIPLEHITIAYRKGGERFRPKGFKHTRTLKNLFQEWRIPPWERATIPLIYYQNELVAVVGFAVI